MNLPWKIYCCRNAGIPGEKVAAAILAAVAAPSDSTCPFVTSPIDVEGFIADELWRGIDESFCCAENNDRPSLQWFSKKDWGLMGNGGTADVVVIWVGGGEGDEGNEPTELGFDALIRVWNGNKVLLLKLFGDKVACCCCWRFLATTAAAAKWLTFVALLKDDIKVSKTENKFIVNAISTEVYHYNNLIHDIFKSYLYPYLYRKS